MHFLDILVVFSQDIGQISFHVVEKTCAARQFALLTTSIVFYEILTWALACAKIKILDEKMTFYIKPFCLANFNTTQEIKKEKQIIVTS